MCMYVYIYMHKYIHIYLLHKYVHIVLHIYHVDKWNKIESPEIIPYIYGQLIFNMGAKIIQ